MGEDCSASFKFVWETLCIGQGWRLFATSCYIDDVCVCVCRMLVCVAVCVPVFMCVGVFVCVYVREYECVKVCKCSRFASE